MSAALDVAYVHTSCSVHHIIYISQYSSMED